jgi:putative hemolysin
LVGFVLAFRVFDTLVDILTARLSLFSAKWLAAAVILIVATYFFSIISVVLPKALANHSPDTIVLRMNKLAILLSLIARPMVWIVELSYKPINALIYGKNEPEEDISEEEILLMVDASGEQGSIDEHEKEMINNIFDFDDKTAGEIATHRKDIVALPIDATTDEIIDVVMSEKFSRIPVYEEDIDHIVGILHVKDFMHAVIAEGKDSFNMRSVLMEPLFVPYTKKTDELFAQMQGLKVHMVVVADEYGGTEGIVTMEDLIEEVMGEIQDEYDEEEEPEIEQVTEDVIKIDGTASLEDVAETLDIDMPTEEYDTLGGFLIGQLDRIPEEDEKDILVEYEGYSFNIDRVEDNRIVSVTVTRINSQI